MENRQFKGIWLPAELYLRKDLTWEQKIIYCEIDSFNQQGMDCYFSAEYLAAFTNCCLRTTKQNIKILKDKNLINIRFDGRNNHYSINAGYAKNSISRSAENAQQEGKNCTSEVQKMHSNNTKKQNKRIVREKGVSAQTIQEEDLAFRFNSILDKFNREQGGMNDIPMNAQERAKFVTWLAQRVIDHKKLKNTDKALLNQITRMRDFEDPRDADSVNSILDDTIRGNDKGVFQNILEPKKKVVRPRSLADEGLHF